MKNAIMNKIIKGAAIAMAAISLAGCTETIRAENYSTTVVATYGEEPVYLSEAMYYVRYEQWYSEMMYGQSGKEFWKYQQASVAGIKERGLATVLQTKILAANAGQYEVALTEADEKKIEEAIANFKESTDEKLQKSMGFTDEVLKKFYMDNALANKVYTAIVEDVSTDVSEEELKLVQTSLLALPKTMKSEEAQAIFDRIKAGEDMEAVATESNETIEEKIVGTDDITEIGMAARELKKDEVVFIETEDGYQIIKCVEEDYKDESEKETKRSSIIAARKDALFQTVYENLKASAAEFKVVDSVWKSIQFNTPVYEAPAPTTEAPSVDAETTSVSELDSVEGSETEGEESTAESTSEMETTEKATTN